MNLSPRSTIVILGAIVLLFIGWFFYRSAKNNQMAYPNQQMGTYAVTTIESDGDLQTAVNALDKINVDSPIDQILDQNDASLHTQAPRIRLKNGTSENWAGYAVETNFSNPQSKSVSDVKGSWTVPAVDCSTATSNTYSSTWVGIDGYNDNTVEQIGTEHDCRNGSPFYYAWYEMYPKGMVMINLPVNAGNSVNAEVSSSGRNNFKLTITVGGQTFSTNQRSNGQRTSAEWITEAPWSGGVLPLANFGTVSFSGASATINGATGPINNSFWQNDSITMAYLSGTPKATPSALSLEGTGFDITWNSN